MLLLKLRQRQSYIPAAALLALLLYGCGEARGPRAESTPDLQPAASAVPTDTLEPTPTETPVPPTATPGPDTPVPSETPDRPLPELVIGQDTWRLTAAELLDRVELSAGPQQHTLTAAAGEAFLVLQIESVAGADLCAAFMQGGANLSDIYLSDGRGGRFVALQITGTLGAPPRATVVFEAIPIAQAAALVFHFLDAEAVALQSLLEPATAAGLPSSEPYYLYPFCNCQEEVPEDYIPVLRWAWVTTSEQYAHDFIDASRTTVHIDGEPFQGLEGFWGEVVYSPEDGGYKSLWVYPLPPLSAGTHEIELNLSLNSSVTDGYDGNGDGRLDQYGPGEVFYGWVRVNLAEGTGQASGVCPNGAPAGHWALTINNTSKGQQTVTIDGERMTVPRGETVVFLTAGTLHSVLVGTNTINFTAPECGENTLELQ